MSAMDKLNDPVYSMIFQAKCALIFSQPFYGILASRMQIMEADKWCKTAATDGRNFYYNREFIKCLTQPELLFLMAHEVEHCVRDHIGRRAGRDPELLNMANDYIINDSLTKEKIGSMPSGGLLHKEYTSEMSSEEVYEILRKNSVTIQINSFDEHLQLGADAKDGKGQKGGGSPGDGKGVSVTVTGANGPPTMTEEDIASLRAEIIADTIRAAQTAGAGHVPAGLKRMLDQLINPVIDWRAMLDSFIKSSVKDDYTFQRMARGTWASRALGFNFLRPPRITPIRLNVALGSMLRDRWVTKCSETFSARLKGSCNVLENST